MTEEVTSGSRRKWILIVAGTLCVLLALLVGVLATREPAVNRLAESELEGKVAPDFAVRLSDGTTKKISELRGRIVLVNFFSSWCIPCRNEHPELIKFAERHKIDGDAVLVSVIFEDQEGKARDYFDKNGGEWPLVADPGGDIAVNYGVRGPPETFVIDNNGFVSKRIVGESTADGLEALVREAAA